MPPKAKWADTKIFLLRSKSKGTAAPGESPYARLKFEGGVHRVQRVPETESQGRIHTSAAGVLILPEAEEIDVESNVNDDSVECQQQPHRADGRQFHYIICVVITCHGIVVRAEREAE
jgi:hypothetical protein